MNLRILKKQCKRAVEVLIAEHGFRPDQFKPADGDETVDASGSMPARFLRHDSLHPGPLPGTPLYWEKSYWDDDADAKLPSEVLRDIICIEHTNWEKQAREWTR